MEALEEGKGEEQAERRELRNGRRDPFLPSPFLQEYLKGLCSPEVWEEVSYPAALHCVFFGARGLFLDCLCWGTSAHIVPQAPGSLLLGGLVEAFVMAQSRLEDLVEQLRQNGLQGPLSGSSREQVSQAFKALVRSYGDEYSRALLDLPVSVQKWLLNLAEEASEGQGLPETPLGGERSAAPCGNGAWEDPVRETLGEGRDVRKGSVPLGTSSVEQEEVREGLYARKEYRPSNFGERDSDRLWSRGEKDSRRTGELVGEKDWPTQRLAEQRNSERAGSPKEGFPRQRNWGKEGFLGERKNWDREWHFGQKDCGQRGHGREEDQDRVRGLEGKGLKRENMPDEGPQREGPQARDQFRSPHVVKTDFLLGANQAESYGHSPQTAGVGQQWRGTPIPLLQLSNGESSPPMGHHLLAGAQPTWLDSSETEDGQPGELQGPESSKGSVDGTTGGSYEVTKTQRFLEVLKTPFSLNLTNVPGTAGLRHIIIDGSNVAMIHGLQSFFSCRGIALAVQYFWDRGHRDITVFLPQWRFRKDARVKECHFLTKLQSLNLLSVTPSRIVDGKRITSYDDRYMMKLAEEKDGIIVSNDQFRDLSGESVKWAEIIRERLLPFTFVGNIFMVPDDPLGREGPTLDDFLKKPNGIHTSRGRSTGRREPPHNRPSRPGSRARSQVRSRAHPRPLPRPQSQPRPHTRGLIESEIQPKQEQKEEDEEISGLRRPRETEQLRHKLLEVFWGQDHKVDFILQQNPSTRDLNQLSEALLRLNF
ncbi:protein KHNYN isoform X2 [Sminthopsis crassicaudata]|uniref:protein KHNYN isoform X2 n=1 Tax=Sminthopsis crassicaudata TaxID=9301 RepID=UPI003D683C33